MTSIRVPGHNQSKHCEYVDVRATCGALDDALCEWLVIPRAEKLVIDVVLFFLLLHDDFNFAPPRGMSG